MKSACAALSKVRAGAMALGVFVADRRRDTVLLVWSRSDGLWFPSSRPSASGFGPAHVEVCQECDGSGWDTDRFGRPIQCVPCAGKGRVARDPMDSLGLPVRSEEAGAPAVVQTVRCDGCDGLGVRGSARCAYCGGEGRRPLHLFELRVDVRDQEERDPLAAAVDRRSEVGSYGELDRALAELREHDRGAHRSLLEAVDETLGVPGVLEEALRFVVVRMPDPVRVPADVRANARLLRDRRTRARGKGPGRSDRAALAVRNAEIRKLDRAGKPVQWIAQEYGLSVRSVYAIVARGEVAA